MQTTIEIPEEQARELEIFRDRIGEVVSLGLFQLKLREALHLLEKGEVSIGRAAQMVGISRDEMARQANTFGIAPNWDQNDLKMEMRL